MPQELLDPQSQIHQDNPLWLRPGETPEQYKARVSLQQSQPVSLDEAETPMPPTFEPTQRVEDTISLQAQVERQRKELEDSYQRQLDDIERQRKEQERIQEEQRKKQEGILGQLETQTTPFREDLERTERQRLQVEQNFFANQALVNELDKLLTESTSLMRQLQTQRVPGLAGLQQSDRMIKAYETAQSRIAIVEAVMSARNNQIGTALTFIDRTKGAIQQDRQDRISYLESLFNFYETTRNEAGQKIFNLTKDEKEIINSQRRLLEQDLARTEATAQRIKDLMLENPQMVAEAGISLNDTEEEISKKLADWQYVTEIREMKNKMEAEGIREVSQPNANTFSHTDSKGITRHFELPPDTPDWQLRTVGNNLYRVDLRTGQMQLLAGSGTAPTAPTAQRWLDPETQTSYEGPQRKPTDEPILFEDETGKGLTARQGARAMAKEQIRLNPAITDEQLFSKLRDEVPELNITDIRTEIANARTETETSPVDMRRPTATVIGNIRGLIQANASVEDIQEYIELSGYNINHPEVQELLEGYVPEEIPGRWERFKEFFRR
jgi:hypothetical protein